MKQGQEHSAVLLTAYMLFVTFLLQGVEAVCSQNDIRAQMQQFYKSTVTASLADSSLQAGLLRAGFHDCVATTSEKEASGCNGSLRSRREREARNNARLGPTIGYVVMTKDSISPCVSYADAVLLGYSAAVKTAAGLSVVRLLVDPGAPRTHVPDGVDDLTSANIVLLPDPTASFDGNLNFYSERGMTAVDLVMSNVVGHAIGSFRNRVNGSQFPLSSFTASPNIAGPQYAAHLLWRQDQSRDTDLQGFATLPSDVSFVENEVGRLILQDYASFKLSRGFQASSVKMAQLSGEIMTGQASFQVPSDIAVLKRSTEDWDGPRDEVKTGSKKDIERNPQLSEMKDADKAWFKVSQNFFRSVYSKVE